MNIELLLFIVFLISFGYMLILTFWKVVYNKSQEFKVNFTTRIFVYITIITFLYFVYLNNFKYGGNYKYLHYSVILISYTFVPIIWSQFINMIILINKTNEDINLKISIQFLSSLILIFYYLLYKGSIFSLNNVYILFFVALSLSFITYIRRGNGN